jgi:hypothetical protein
MSDLIDIFITRGDLAHLALFLWASTTTALAWFAFREMTQAARRFDDFVRELARFNELHRQGVIRKRGNRFSEKITSRI